MLTFCLLPLLVSNVLMFLRASRSLPSIVSPRVSRLIVKGKDHFFAVSHLFSFFLPNREAFPPMFACRPLYQLLFQKLERIGEIFAFFCKDKQLRQAIRSMDVEQYDELIEITTVADS